MFAGLKINQKYLTTTMYNYMLYAIFFGSCQCISEKLPTPQGENLIPVKSSIQYNPDSRLHSNIVDSYFPEVEYPKSVLEAHKPFFYKGTNTYFDRFAPEVQNNFKIITEKTNNAKKKEINAKHNSKENIKNIDSNRLSSEEIFFSGDTGLNAMNSTLDNVQNNTILPTSYAENETLLETCNIDEDYYYANITYGNDDIPVLALSIFEIDTNTSDKNVSDSGTVENQIGSDKSEGTKNINDNDHVQHFTDSQDISGHDFIELIEVISDLIGVVKDTVTKMVTTADPK